MSVKTHYAIAQANETDQAFEVGSITPANSAGPSCKHFFPANEGSGTTLTDVIGGANLATATNLWGTGPNGGGYHNGGDTPAEATAAAFNDFTTDDFMAYFVVDRGDQAVIGTAGMGGDLAGEYGIIIAVSNLVSGGTISIEENGSAFFTSAAIPVADPNVSTSWLSVGIVKDGNNGHVWARHSGGVYTEDFDATALGTFQPTQKLVQSLWSYGMGMWTGYKSDYATAFDWMNTKWRAGQKVLYPGWIDD